MLLASGGLGLRTLLNTIQREGWPPTTKNYPAPSTHTSEVEELWFISREK